MSGRDAPTLDAVLRRCCRDADKRVTAPRTTGRRSCCRAVKRHHVWALYAFCRYADDIVDDLGDASVGERAQRPDDFGERFFADLAAGRLRRPGAAGRRPHGAGLRARPRAASAASCARWRWISTVDQLRDLGRPARLHGRLGGGDRRDDAAHPRAAEPGGARHGPRPRPRLPAHQLPARRRRGPRPRPGVPARRRTSSASAPTRWRAPSTTPGVALMRFEIDRCRALYRSADIGHRRCCRRRRRAACAPRACSTPRSSTGSRRPTTTCSPAGAGADVAQGGDRGRGSRRWLTALSRRALVARRCVGVVAGVVVARPAARARRGAPAAPARCPSGRDRHRPGPRRGGDPAALLASLAVGGPSPREVIVVDDASTDATAAVAAAVGATVVARRPPPPGWPGKPWACHAGAERGHRRRCCCSSTPTSACARRPRRASLAAHAAHRRAGVGAAATTADERPYEELSAMFNVVSMMGTGASRRRRRRPARSPSVPAC